MKNFIHKVFLIAILYSISSCDSGNKQRVIFESDKFNIYNDHVTQGEFTSKVVSKEEMTSDYKSPLADAYSRKLIFKFSLNRKDNELPAGKDHELVIFPKEGKYVSPVIKWGQRNTDDTPFDEMDWLEKNTEATFRLDLSEVINSFKEQGIYEDRNGEIIAENDFKGVFIAGGRAPLGWDFENLEEDKKLQDPDGDGIYEITLTLNTANNLEATSPTWKLSKDISQYPQYSSNIPLVNALYNLSLEETLLNSEADGTFRTGAKWEGVWTRDVSYAIVLGLGIADAERAMTSLRKKVRRNRIIQDTGSGGAWPVSSDRTTWALAAWELYLVTGDQAWLEEAYTIISNTLEDDRKVVYSKDSGLMKGESSFLDWRKQTYPIWMDNVDIFRSENLGTNAVHFQSMKIAVEMAKLLGENEEAEKYNAWAEDLKKAINEQLWLDDKGYFAQYRYGRTHQTLSPKSETLGEAFTVLFDIADEKRQNSIVSQTEITPYGAQCVYPQIPGIVPYHNDGVWPFVQGYWNLAAAKAGNGKALEHGLASMYRAAAMFLTNKENYVAQNGDFETALNSDRQLWSVGANLGMVYKVFFGIHISPEGYLNLNPSVPKSYQGDMHLTHLKLRNATVHLHMKGYGNKIKTVKINGQEAASTSIDLNAQKTYEVDIVLAGNDFTEGQQSNFVENHYHLSTPQAFFKGRNISWEKVEEAVAYELFENGVLKEKLGKEQLSYSLNEMTDGLKSYAVRAVDKDGYYSFLSEPILDLHSKSTVIRKEVENYAPKGVMLDVSAYEGSGFVKLSVNENTSVTMPINVPSAGEYFVWFKYANGSGPWNTDNKCAIRTLSVNGDEVAPLIMAQRGKDEWSSWGETNMIKVNMKKGTNQLNVSLKQPYNTNMNVDVNTALLDQVILVKSGK